MKNLQTLVKSYEVELNNLFYDINDDKVLDNTELDEGFYTTLENVYSDRFDIEQNFEKLNSDLKEKVASLDEKLLEIKKHLEGTIYEETFNEWFSKFLPKPATL